MFVKATELAKVMNILRFTEVVGIGQANSLGLQMLTVERFSALVQTQVQLSWKQV